MYNRKCANESTIIPNEAIAEDDIFHFLLLGGFRFSSWQGGGDSAEG